MKVIIASIMAMTLTILSTSSQATMIVRDANHPYQFLSQDGLQSHTVIHSLADYDVPSDYRVVDAMLVLAFSDGYYYQDYAWDMAFISADGISRLFEVDGTHHGGFDYRWIHIGQDGIDSLNLDGQLAVTVTAIDTPDEKGINDFWWKKSKLFALVKPAAVPEPGTLGLLGLGLLGIAAGRRFRKI